MPRAPRRRAPKIKVPVTPKARAMINLGGHDPSTGTHGTVMTPGQTTVDPSEIGVTPTFEMSLTDRAYFTSHHPDRQKDVAEERGWSWAKAATHGRGDPEGKTLMGRPVVHEVEPIGTVDHDVNMGNLAHGSMTADQLRITDTHWIRKPHQDEAGVQGTLPHINWNQHADAGFGSFDLNNPGISKTTGHLLGSVEHDQAVYEGKGGRMLRLSVPGSTRETYEAQEKAKEPRPQPEHPRLF